MNNDLISRQAAIDAVSDLYWMDERLLNFKKEIDATFDKIKELPSAQRWIPVSERLPEDETKVLVTVFFRGVKDYSGGWNAHIKPSFYVDIAEHYDDEWHSDSDEYKIARNRHEVIAWMPLPEPYKEDKNDVEIH